MKEYAEMQKKCKEEGLTPEQCQKRIDEKLDQEMWAKAEAAAKKYGKDLSTMTLTNENIEDRFYFELIFKEAGFCKDAFECDAMVTEMLADQATNATQ